MTRRRRYGVGFGGGVLVALALIVVVALAVPLVGCGGGTTTTAPEVTTATSTATTETTVTETTASAPAVSEWVIPQLTILTGPGAQFGSDAKFGAEFAAAEINAAGGINGVPIKLVMQDTAMDPARTVTELTKAVESALIVIGPMDQGGAEAAGDVAVKAGTPFITSLNMTSLVERFAPWGLAVYPNSDDTVVDGIRLWVEANPSIKTVVIGWLPSDPWHQAMIPLHEKTFADLGVEVLGRTDANYGQIDFGPTAVKALEMKPDGFYSMMAGEEHARFVTELRKRGVIEGWRICAGISAMGQALLDVGGTALDDTYIWDWVNWTESTPQLTAMTEANGGKTPFGIAAISHYNAVYAVKDAIEKAGVTGDPTKLAEERKAIADYLWNAQDIHGLVGPYSYTNGDKKAPVFLFTIKDSQFTLTTSSE